MRGSGDVRRSGGRYEVAPDGTFAGTIGGGGRLEYTVVGDAVNVAQRLQSEAGAGEVLATAATVAAVPGIPVESVGPWQVKGRKESVEVYRVLAPEPEAAT